MLRIFLLFLLASIASALLFLGLKIRAEDKYPSGESSIKNCEAATFHANESRKGRQATKLLAQALDDDNGAGLAAAVVINGDLIWSGGVGKADRRHRIAMRANSRLRIGSVSKPITAALTAALAEQRVIDLDAPIQSYVTDFPDSSQPITIKMLATHLSGIRHYDFANFDEANNREQFETLTDALALLGDNPFIADPLAQEYYSSFGYNLIGAAIENATDMEFGDVLIEYLGQPMGLDSLIVDDPSVRTRCRSRFYTVYFGALTQNTIWRNHSDAYPSAGILISAADLAMFTNKTFASDFFSEQSKALFTTPGVTTGGEETSYSFGWHVDRNTHGDVESFSHGGITNGAYAEVKYFPETRMSVAVISNYNLWLTDKRPAFNDLSQTQLPELFGADG